MVKDEIIEYLDGSVKAVDAPLREGVAVERVVPSAEGGFDVRTSEGAYRADAVVAASGGYHEPIVPRLAERLPKSIVPAPLRAVSQSAIPAGGRRPGRRRRPIGRADRRGPASRGPARPSRGRRALRVARAFIAAGDVVAWLADMSYYDMPVERHPLREGVRDNTNHYVTGRDGGRDIDLRQFALEGMELYGALTGFDGESLRFEENLRACLDDADRTYNGINASIDKYIGEAGIDAPPPSVYAPVWTPGAERGSLALEGAGIAAILWCIGFRPDFRWLDAPAFNGAGQPKHTRGVTACEGVYFLGLPWLHTWGSGRFSAVGRDALYLADHIEQRLSATSRPSRALRAAPVRMRPCRNPADTRIIRSSDAPRGSRSPATGGPTIGPFGGVRRDPRRCNRTSGSG